MAVPVAGREDASPELLRQLAWGVPMLLLGLGMLPASDVGQLIGYSFGMPAICLLGGMADTVAAWAQRRAAWGRRLAGGALDIGVVAAVAVRTVVPMPDPGPHGNGLFSGLLALLVVLLVSLVPWGLLNAALSLTGDARTRPAAMALGCAQALTAFLAGLPLVHAALAPTEDVSVALDVTIRGQIVVLLAGGAAIVVLAARRQRRRLGAPR